jgi:hypothetical protein
LHVEHPHLEPLEKEKKKAKEVKPKGTPRILMPPKGQQISIGGTNQRDKPDKTQIKHLQNLIDNLTKTKWEVNLSNMK